jgi:hypothetical protein
MDWAIRAMAKQKRGDSNRVPMALTAIKKSRSASDQLSP